VQTKSETHTLERPSLRYKHSERREGECRRGGSAAGFEVSRKAVRSSAKILTEVGSFSARGVATLYGERGRGAATGKEAGSNRGQRGR
jgi:hypothetical protein